MNMKQFALSIDHHMLQDAKASLDEVMNRMVSKAMSTGSMEGTVTLKIGMEIKEVQDLETGEWRKEPTIKFKANYAVPIKEGAEGKVMGKSSLQPDPDDGWLLLNNQVTMDELLNDEEPEEGA